MTSGLAVSTIDREGAIDRMQRGALPAESGFLVRNSVLRLGVLVRPGALAEVDPQVPAATGDIVLATGTAPLTRRWRLAMGSAR